MTRKMLPEVKEGRRLIREAFAVLPLEAWAPAALWIMDRYGYRLYDETETEQPVAAGGER